MSIHLQRDLDILHRHIMSMCAMVEEIVHKAVEDLSSPDAELSRKLVAQDDEIDRWDVRIEEECLKILALHAPAVSNSSIRGEVSGACTLGEARFLLLLKRLF